MPVNTPIMPKGIINAEWFEATETALKDLKGMSDGVWTIQAKEIHELFQSV